MAGINADQDPHLISEESMTMMFGVATALAAKDKEIAELKARLGQSQAIPQWIACDERMPEYGALIVKYWDKPGSTWSGVYRGETGFDRWFHFAAPTPQGENHGRD